MLTLIKLINTLNQQVDRVRSNLEHHTVVKFQTILAIIALSVAGVGSIETVQAKSLDRESIRHSLQLVASNTSTAAIPQDLQLVASNTSPEHRSLHLATPRPLKPATKSLDRLSGKRIAQTPPAPVEKVAPTPPPEPVDPTPPEPTTTGARGKLPNNLEVPQSVGEVQITNTQALTLQDAIATAFRNNRDVQAARLTVERSQAGVTTAQSAKSPQIGMTGNVTNQGSPLIVGNSTPNQLNNSTEIGGGLQATYPIFNGGRDEGSIRAAQEQVNFDRLDLLRVEQKLRADVITAYYDLQEADSAVIINNAAVKDATRSLSDAQLQEKAGVGTKFDILRAQVQLATSNQALTTAGGQQKTARKRIAQLLSVSERTDFRTADAVAESGTWRYSLEDSILLAFKNRPEIKQQLVRRSISEQQQIIAAASDSAQVNLFANYNIGKNLNSTLSAQDNYSVGARLSWNFWDGGAAKSRSYQEKVSQEINENQFTSTRNQVRFEVEQAYNGLATNKANIATATQALQQAEESLKLARLRFQAGVGTQTDVIQAQTELARARGNRITAILNYNRSLSSIRTATVSVP